MDKEKPKRIQALEFEIDRGKPVLWIFDVQVPKEDLNEYEFISIINPIYSLN